MPVPLENLLEAFNQYPMQSQFVEITGYPAPMDLVEFLDRFLDTYPTARQLLLDFPLGAAGLDDRVNQPLGSS